MPVVRECIEVDPSQAMGRTSPDYPDRPVNDATPLGGGVWLVGRVHPDGSPSWLVRLERGETLTVYAEEGEG
jgi:hypothetical protein